MNASSLSGTRAPSATSTPNRVARSSLRQNVLLMSVGQAITWSLTALTLALLPRYLGPDRMGQLGIGLSFAGIGGTIAGLGMATLLTKEIARDRERARAMLGTAVWLNVLFGLVVGAACTALGSALGYSRMTQVAIAANCLVIPFNLLTLLGFNALQGIEVMRYQAVYDAANKLVMLTGLCAIVVLDLGFGAYLALSVASAVVMTLPAMVLTARYLPFRALSVSLRHARYLVTASIPFCTVGIFLVVYLATDTLLLSWLSGERAVGIYTAPGRIFGTLLFAPTIITTVVFPRMAATARDDPSELRRIARVTLAAVVGITLPVAVLTVGVSGDLLARLIGNDFSQSGPVIVVLAFALLPTSVNMVAHRVLIAVDRQKVWTAVMLVALAGKAAVEIALIPLFAAWMDNAALGAAAGLVLAESAMMVCAFLLMPRGVLDGSVVRLCLRLALASAAAAGTMFAIRGLAFPVVGAAGGVAYGAAALMLGAYRPSQILDVARWLLGRTPAAAQLLPSATAQSTSAPERLAAGRLKCNRAATRRPLPDEVAGLG